MSAVIIVLNCGTFVSFLIFSVVSWSIFVYVSSIWACRCFLAIFIAWYFVSNVRVVVKLLRTLRHSS